LANGISIEAASVDSTSSKKLKKDVSSSDHKTQKVEHEPQKSPKAKRVKKNEVRKQKAVESIDDHQRKASSVVQTPLVEIASASNGPIADKKKGHSKSLAVTNGEQTVDGVSGKKKTKKRTASESIEKVTSPKPEIPLVAGNDLQDEDFAPEEEDDQTAALLKGFESSSDSGDASQDEGYDPSSTTVPALPIDKNLLKKLDSAASKSNPNGQSGVLYVGRIPHGFYEHQMHAYFAQFGDIKQLRLSRNRRTGASKHYAFIEFSSEEVARIVAHTMDNYLMFGHLLKVKLLAREQVHKELFKDAGRRFKKVPWNRIERARLGTTDREGWEKRVVKEEKRREEKKEKLKSLGYVFEAPKLRMVGDVPVQAVEEKLTVVAAEDAVKQGENGSMENQENRQSLQMQVDELMTSEAPRLEQEMKVGKKNKKSKKNEKVPSIVAQPGENGLEEEQNVVATESSKKSSDMTV